ncbi:hypothetical protein [Dokdonella sp.]|uniref:hypothetical protein n=1 Tax=Dokdonella sp. TaxID=2291710 RepID=UPI003C63DD9A
MSMKLMNTYLAGSLRAALSLALVAASGAVMAQGTSALIGGDLVSGDQATVKLDATVPSSFQFVKPASGASTATAYFNSHVFCADAPLQPSQVSLLPRYQLPASVGNDVWRFPDVYLQSFVYEGSGFHKNGSPTLYMGQATSLATSQFRCLNSTPGSSTEFPNVSQGLFDSTFGGNSAGTPPDGPHQNIVVSGESFAGFSGKAVTVVSVEMQFDPTTPAGAGWTLVDGFNTSALSAITDANWCLLRSDWVGGSVPPAGLCDDNSILFPGFFKETGPFVYQPLVFPSGSPGPFYVLVYRDVAGSPTAGTPAQGFAAVRTSGGMAGVSEESQDWYSDDSVWYVY